MTDRPGLLVLRHGPTLWNEAKRLQGRRDIPLSEAGVAAVRGWRLPEPAEAREWFTSPLERCRQTARLLGLTARVELRLIEMDWGAWEGWRLADLRRRWPDAMARWEALGLDLRPDGGETPREVQARLLPWLAERAASGRPTGAVTHRGVMRALYALAAGWDMAGPPPEKLDPATAHLFGLRADGGPLLLRLNLPLSPEEGGAAPKDDDRLIGRVPSDPLGITGSASENGGIET